MIDIALRVKYSLMPLYYTECNIIRYFEITVVKYCIHFVVVKCISIALAIRIRKRCYLYIYLLYIFFFQR